MNQQEIIDEVQRLLEGHYKQVFGHMDQEPYKGDFFRLFKAAYRGGYFDTASSPRLTGDALRAILAERWFMDDSGDAKKEQLVDQLFTKWDEWRYAWDNYDR